MPDDRDPITPPAAPDPGPLDDDTEPLVFDLDDEPAPPTQPGPADPAHTQPSMRPVQPTLPGSGGLDPNPDFKAPRTVQQPRVPEPRPSNPNDLTAPHLEPLQHTYVHVPGQTGQNAPRTVQGQPPAPQRPAVTQPANRPPQAQPTVARGANYPQPPQRGYPAPPRAPTGGLPAGVAPRRPPRKRRVMGCRPGCLALFVGIFAAMCGGISLLALILTATLGSQLEQRLNQQVAQVDNYDAFQSTFFYDRNGALLYESFNEGRRTNIPYAEFPQNLINATIAIEDDSFFSNPGFEVEATLRAMLQYFGVASGSSGGSTITQQLVRNVLFEPEYRAERSIQRKVEEILLAFLLRRQKSPEEVLALYLNEIYYGNLSYGAEAAAQNFFGKSARDLTLAEAALLAGLPQAPANLDPFSADPDVQQAVRERWELVLQRMVEEGYITDLQREDALSQGYLLSPPDAPLNAPHFTVYAQQELERLLTNLGYGPEVLARGGLRVYTTVDLDLDERTRQIAAQQVASLAGSSVSNAAVVVLKPVTGEILSMVGSIDYDNEAIDGNVNVTIALRQPGSTVKPFTYSAAMELGMTPGDIIWDVPIDIAGYRPVNYDGRFHGPVRLRTALANSYNIPAVQTLRRTGVESLIAIMRRFGIESIEPDPSRYGLSLTLGGGDVTLLEMTRGFSVFANGGAYVPTTSILCVLDANENILYTYSDGCTRGRVTDDTEYGTDFGTQVLDPRIAFYISDVLADNAARTPAMGSNSPLYTPNIGSSVKTGTTNDFKDNWTVGYTRNVAVGVWVGNNDGTPMAQGVSGLTGAAPIWNGVMNLIYGDQVLLAQFAEGGQLQPDRLDAPGGMSQRPMCAIDSLRDPAMDCPSQVSDWFLDSPAGIPDGLGNINYPPAPAPVSNEQPPAGPWLRPIDGGMYRTYVHPIPPDIGQQVIFNVQPGTTAPPPPIYCQMPVELVPSDPAARDQLFLEPPLFPEDMASAEQYARNNNLPFLPTIVCSVELVQAAGSGGAGPITAYIASPANGSVIPVGSPIPILGTAQFSNGQAQYYKVEIAGGDFPGWTTIGNTHSGAVANGVLENLPPLAPGSYQIQLVVVGNDGNYVQQPFQVGFTVQ
jgi:penicillin-binding protein 1C